MLEQMKKVEDELEHQDAEVDRLNAIVRDAMNQIYHSDKHDNIDQALGNVLNSYPEREKLQILFLRESEGVYQFGQKRVFIKIEKGNNILVRVGGGFMHIHEFIN